MRRINKGREARMILAAAIGQYEPDEIRDNVLGCCALGWQSHVLQSIPRVGGHRLVDRLLRQLVEVGREYVHELMAEIAESISSIENGDGMAL